MIWLQVTHYRVLSFGVNNCIILLSNKSCAVMSKTPFTFLKKKWTPLLTFLKLKEKKSFKEACLLEKIISQSEFNLNWRDIFIKPFKIKPHPIKFQLIPNYWIYKYITINFTQKPKMIGCKHGWKIKFIYNSWLQMKKCCWI